MNAVTQHLQQLGAHLEGLQWQWLTAAVALQLVNLSLRAVTWRNVLAAAYPDGRLAVGKVALAYAVGVGLNGYLPARGGDLTKIAIVKKQIPGAKLLAVGSSAAALAIVDAAIGMMLLVWAWTQGYLPVQSPNLSYSTLGLVIAVGALVFVLMRRYARRTMQKVGQQASHGLRVFKQPSRYLGHVLAPQLLAWCCRITVVFCWLSAFSINVPIALAAVVVAALGMATLVPVPGGAGSQQALATFVLASAASAHQAVAFSLGMQLGITLFNSLLGLLAAMLVFGQLHPWRALQSALTHARSEKSDRELAPSLRS